MAEKVGFEPTHALTRLADFESAPLGLLGTSPHVINNISYNLSLRKHLFGMLKQKIHVEQYRALLLALCLFAGLGAKHFLHVLLEL